MLIKILNEYKKHHSKNPKFYFQFLPFYLNARKLPYACVHSPCFYKKHTNALRYSRIRINKRVNRFFPENSLKNREMQWKFNILAFWLTKPLLFLKERYLGLTSTQEPFRFKCLIGKGEGIFQRTHLYNLLGIICTLLGTFLPAATAVNTRGRDEVY